MSTATKDRSMATGPYPLRAYRRPVVLEGAGGARTRRVVGHHAIIHQSDGTDVPCCTTPHGHRQESTLVACATRRVAELNDAAGIPEAVR